MAAANPFSLLEDTDDVEVLSIHTTAVSEATSVPTSEQGEASQPPQDLGGYHGGLRLPGNGRGQLYGIKARQGQVRRLIDVTEPVKKQKNKPEEQGAEYCDPDYWGYYRDEEGRWWYVDGRGGLWMLHDHVAIVADRGYHREGDGRKWYLDGEGKWWAKHVSIAKTRATGGIKDGESNGKLKAEQVAKLNNGKKKKNNSKNSNETVSQKPELPIEDFANSKTLDQFQKELEERRKPLEAMKAQERKVNEELYTSMKVMGKQKDAEPEFIKLQKKAEGKKEKANGENMKDKEDQNKVPAPKVPSIAEILKFNYKGTRGGAPGHRYNSVPVNTTGQVTPAGPVNSTLREGLSGGGYKGGHGHSNGHGSDGRYQGRFFNRNGPCYNGDRRGDNDNSSVQTGRNVNHSVQAGPRIRIDSSGQQGRNDNRYQSGYPDHNGDRYNRDRRVTNTDEEPDRPVTHMVQVTPPPCVEDLQQFPALSLVSKA